MEIEKIVLKAGSELPENCNVCEQHWYLPLPFKHYVSCHTCSFLSRELPENCTIERPSWCPLQVEEECIWVGEYGGYDEHGDTIFFSKKTSCSDVHIQKVIVPDNTYCSNCGRRIKYKEEK